MMALMGNWERVGMGEAWGTLKVARRSLFSVKVPGGKWQRLKAAA
jgi:hypothetical protein